MLTVVVASTSHAPPAAFSCAGSKRLSMRAFKSQSALTGVCKLLSSGRCRAGPCSCQPPRSKLQTMCETIDQATGDSIGVFTYDGDTPQDARRTIRSRAHLVLSNPDMVHAGILPHHPRWAKLFENLRYVIIDELHAYRGVDAGCGRVQRDVGVLS